MRIDLTVRRGLYIAASSVCALLTACGGGGGDSPPPPPLPTVSLTANPTSVTKGLTSQLSWTSTNATSCTASGGWTGARSTSGSAATGALTATTSFALACTGTGGNASASATVTLVNARPTSNAGPDQTVFGGSPVTLNGSASADTDGTIATYAWSQTSGPTVSLSSTTAATPTFTAPTVLAAASLVFSLTVSDDLGAASAAADTVTITVNPGATVSGRITFDRIPFKAPPGLGLNYAGMRQDPARGVLVSIVRAVPPLDVLGTATTDANGMYSAVGPANTQVVVRVTAEMTRAAPLPSPRWRFRVRDLDANTDYSSQSAAVLTGVAGGAATTVNYNVPSGWTTAGAPSPTNPTRAAAPFAILDTAYTILTKLQQVNPTMDFPELVFDWAPSNAAGSTFYRRDGNNDGDGSDRFISLSGQVNVDTEEYDPTTIAHEFGHYLEDRFSRSDSIGGRHSVGDRLDLRVAFGEGFGYAFAGMMLDTPLMRDSAGPNQANESFFNIESDTVLNAGWYSESSVHHILWDLYDNVADANDNVALGFGPIWQNLIGPQRETDAVTSIFSFITTLKAANAGQAAGINTIVAAQSIAAATMDAFGTGETNNALNPSVLPVHTSITVGGGSRTISSLNPFGNGNKLGVRRLLPLTVSTGTTARVTVTAARDADIVVRRRGTFVAYRNGAGNEDFTFPLGTTLPATFILDVYDAGIEDSDTTIPAAGTVNSAITVTVTTP